MPKTYCRRRVSPPHPKTMGDFSKDDIWCQDGFDPQRFKARYWQKAGDIDDTCQKVVWHCIVLHRIVLYRADSEWFPNQSKRMPKSLKYDQNGFPNL